jgi:hypothetical protein
MTEITFPGETGADLFDLLDGAKLAAHSDEALLQESSGRYLPSAYPFNFM